MPAGLFDSLPTSAEGETIVQDDGEALYYPHLFSASESDKLFAALRAGILWQQDSIRLFGKEQPLPRLTAWYGDSDKPYTYSGIVMTSHSWTDELRLIKERIEPLAKVEFTSVLLNLYRKGQDSVAWHRDDEPELGRNPVIGSVSFGATRKFQLKHEDGEQKASVDLTHGSFLLMRGSLQHHWLHQIPKTARTVGERINLTFRVIL